VGQDIRDLSGYGTATLLEACPDVRALSNNIRPLFCPIDVCGVAYPVDAPPGDNLPVHLALAEAPAGSVLMVRTQAETHKGFWGEVMTEAAIARQLSGLITDGAVRDTRSIRKLQFPVFSVSIAIAGTLKAQAGRRNCSIEIGGVNVSPGDVVVGDDDGVVIIPQASVPIVREAAALRSRKECDFINKIRHGALTVDLLGLRR
jgi:4-hydroxy-4-methyl-2-oxoglutarate aldolase